MIRYVSSIHWSDTRYVSRYVSYHLLNKNIAETVIKLKSHMFHANIEAGIEHVCNISLATGIFRNSPWHLGQGNLLTIHFIETLWQSPKSKNWSRPNTRPQSYDCHSLWSQLCTCTTYINITMLPENGEPAYRIYVWRIPTILLRCIDATISWTRPRLRSHPVPARLGCHSTHSVGEPLTQTRSASSYFSRVVCNWAARGRLLETLLALFFIFTACFWSYYFAVIAHVTCVKAFSRGGKHRPGKFHWRISTGWNASRMRWINTCEIVNGERGHYLVWSVRVKG